MTDDREPLYDPLAFTLLLLLLIASLIQAQSLALKVQSRAVERWKTRYAEEQAHYKGLAREIVGIRELVIGDGRREVLHGCGHTLRLLPEANQRLEELLTEEWIATEDWELVNDPELNRALLHAWDEAQATKREDGSLDF